MKVEIRKTSKKDDCCLVINSSLLSVMISEKEMGRKFESSMLTAMNTLPLSPPISVMTLVLPMDLTGKYTLLQTFSCCCIETVYFTEPHSLFRTHS